MVMRSRWAVGLVGLELDELDMWIPQPREDQKSEALHEAPLQGRLKSRAEP